MTAAYRLAAHGVAALIILACGVFGAVAQAPTPGEQVPLTATIVERLIDSVPAVQETAKGLQAKYDVHDGGFGDDPVGAWQAWLAYSDASSALGKVCQQYGFADFPTWLSTFSSVAMAHAFARQGGTMDDEMAQAIEAIRSNPDLSDDQKEMMLKQVEATATSLNAMRPSQQNIDAVAPYGDRLDALFEDG